MVITYADLKYCHTFGNCRNKLHSDRKLLKDIIILSLNNTVQCSFGSDCIYYRVLSTKVIKPADTEQSKAHLNIYFYSQNLIFLHKDTANPNYFFFSSFYSSSICGARCCVKRVFTFYSNSYFVN